MIPQQHFENDNSLGVRFVVVLVRLVKSLSTVQHNMNMCILTHCLSKLRTYAVILKQPPFRHQIFLFHPGEPLAKGYYMWHLAASVGVIPYQQNSIHNLK